MAIQATDTRKPDPKAETGLITIEEAQIPSLFETPGALDPLVVKVREIVEAFVPDTTTEEGRAAIASLAYKIARAKNFADDLGAAHKKKLNELPKIIDANRSKFWNDLEVLQKQARKPLDDWEANQDRIRAILADLEKRPESFMSAVDDQFVGMIEQTQALQIDDSFGEWKAKAEEARDRRLRDLLDLQLQRRSYDTEQAELAQLREEKAERERAKAKEEADAAEAKRQEELKAKAEEEARAKVQADLEAAQRREEEQRQAAAKAEADRLAAAEKAEADRIQAQKDADARAQKLADEAAAKEREKIEAQKRAEADAAAARERDLENRKKVLGIIAADLIEVSALQPHEAEILARALADGKVRNVQVLF